MRKTLRGSLLNPLVSLFAILCVFACATDASGENQAKSVVPLIVGGEEATKNEFPWIVRFQVGPYLCGGSLIEMDLVLTAAHCVFEFGPENITVFAGDHDRNITESTEQILKASKVVWHEGYVSNNSNADFLQNDVALIKTTTRFNETAAVKKIAVPAATYDVGKTDNLYGTVAGWGVTELGDAPSQVLRKALLSIVRNSSECPPPLTSSDTQFCAESPGKDSCQGDSGGPFICGDLPGHVCGIVSAGIGCATPDFPGMYQKVSAYASWIEKKRVELGSGSGGSGSAPTILISNMLATVVITDIVVRLGIFYPRNHFLLKFV